MNLSTVALLLLAWQLLGNAKKPNISDFLSEDSKGILDCFAQLKQGNSTDKMGAILQMMNNPAFAELTKSFFSNTKNSSDEPPKEEFTNEEGYRFEQPSEKSKQFFRPIENIADAEVKNKLYKFFENWYVT